MRSTSKNSTSKLKEILYHQGKVLTIFMVTFFLAFITSGCSKKDVNRKNLGKAINQHLEKEGDLCLNVPKWPIEVKEKEISFFSSKEKNMEALEKVGLVSHTESKVDEINMWNNKPTGKKLTIKQYELTSMGKKFYREKSSTKRSQIGSSDLCYGKMSLNKVVKWKNEVNLGGIKAILVIYTYKIDHLASWAKEKVIRDTFPSVNQNIEGAEKEEKSAPVELTSEGWEVM